MIKQKIYIDTSVIGGCFDKEFEKWSNNLLNDFKNGLFIPVISDVISAEILNAPQKVKDKYAELFTYRPELLEITEDAITLAQIYLNRNILTQKYFEDCLHIAIATIAKVDILVSWNFKHIVHFDKIRMFNSVNLELGYKPIEIYSPREVTSNE